jgi:hypothetical protein
VGNFNMAAIYSNGGNRWNILGFNFTKRDALSSGYKISMVICSLREEGVGVGGGGGEGGIVDLSKHILSWFSIYFKVRF